MLRILVTLILIGVASAGVRAQSGHYFLTHYNPGSDKINYLSYDIHQDKHGILYFANRTGVLQFDGRTWTQIPARGAIYALAMNAAGELFACGSGGFGRLRLNERNQMEYESLSDSIADTRNVFAAVSAENEVYFLSETRVYRIPAQSSKAEVVASSSGPDNLFSGLYQVGSTILVDSENEGLRKIQGNSLVQPDFLAGRHLVFSEPSPDHSQYLLATDDGKFYVYRNGGLAEIFPKDSGYLVTNVVANATWINDQRVAIGTLRGGVIFMDLETAETVETTNYFTGLPDNEVFALHTDRHQGVWMAHEYGFTRAAPFLPFRTYNHYPGLAGNLLCVQSFRGTLYVGTTLGLFSLVERQIFGTETYEVLQTIATEAQEVEPPVTVSERKKTRRGFLGFGKKKKEEPAPEEPAPVKKQAPAVKHRAKVQKTRQVLRGVQHEFTQVLGISGKVDQLIIVDDRLIAGGVGGVFEVKDLVGIPVRPEPSRAVYYSSGLDALLISNYDNEILMYRPVAVGWKNEEFPDSLSLFADYFFEDNSQNVWICGRDRVLRVGVEEKEIVDAEEIPLPYTSIDKTVGLAYGREVYITQNGEFFHYLGYKNAFVKYDSLPGPKKYFASSGAFWFHDGHRWRTVDRRKQGELKTEWLALFPDIRFLAPAEMGKSLWVITASNDLYKFSSEFATAISESNPLFLKEVRNQQERLSPKKLSVDERESALTFEFIQPEYVSLQAIEYHYWVKGLQSTWSDWSTLNNVINFPFLPPGNYSVMVESRDLFGRITKLDTIEVDVVPPYWKRPAFYALEFIVFATLVVFSMRLNVATARYRMLSQFLSALTVVLLIQFIQVVVVANLSFRSTPVADFFVQVGIALLVLPVENFLRRRMIRAAEKSHH
ncbi:MAG: hypothetical protein JNN04_15665 [Cyclobacteriaceae bacterium]|nr:hypothetical protein [Cyclobacteriaceae bacterium]